MTGRDAKGRFRSAQYELVWTRVWGEGSGKVQRREPVDVLLFGTDVFVAVRKDGTVERMTYVMREGHGYYYNEEERTLVRVTPE